MAPRHLVSHGQLPLNREIDFDHLEDTRGQLIPLLQAGDLLIEDGPNDHGLVLHIGEQSVDLSLSRGVGDLNISPVPIRNGSEGFLRNEFARPNPFLTALLIANPIRGRLAHNETQDIFEGTLSNDPNLVFLILPQAINLGFLEGFRSFVFLHPSTREDLRANDGSRDPRRNAK